jgi:hypothetical protein
MPPCALCSCALCSCAPVCPVFVCPVFVCPRVPCVRVPCVRVPPCALCSYALCSCAMCSCAPVCPVFVCPVFVCPVFVCPRVTLCSYAPVCPVFVCPVFACSCQLEGHPAILLDLYVGGTLTTAHTLPIRPRPLHAIRALSTAPVHSPHHALSTPSVPSPLHPCALGRRLSLPRDVMLCFVMRRGRHAQSGPRPQLARDVASTAARRLRCPLAPRLAGIHIVARTP